MNGNRSEVLSPISFDNPPISLDWWKEDLRDETFYKKFQDRTPNYAGVIAKGGDLSPSTLLEAYARGIFPWYSELPIKWYSPYWRCVIPLDSLNQYKVSKSFTKFLKTHSYKVVMDHNFPAVIRHCAEVKRDQQYGTWITPEMMTAYIKLFELGVAHSVEVYKENIQEGKTEQKLVGGLYGLSLGKAFFGESMFSLESNTSKLALHHLVTFLRSHHFHFIDGQDVSDHLLSLGAIKMERNEFLKRLHQSNREPSLIGRWS